MTRDPSASADASRCRAGGGQGFGFLESVYKKAMMIELGKINLKVEQEKPLKVYYDNQEIGEFFIDLFIENEIIVELKSVENLLKAHACPACPACPVGPADRTGVGPADRTGVGPADRTGVKSDLAFI